MAPTLQLDNVHKSFGRTEVLKDVSLAVEGGEFVVFVGPSGCGKSTLLRLICGLDEASAGRLMIDGELVNDVPPAKRGIAMVFQSYALYPHMTYLSAWAEATVAPRRNTIASLDNGVEVATIIGEEVQAVLLDQKDAATAAKDMQARIEAAL